MNTATTKQVGNKEIPQDMFDTIVSEMEYCRAAFVAGFGGADLIRKYRDLCDTLYDMGLPIDAFL